MARSQLNKQVKKQVNKRADRRVSWLACLVLLVAPLAWLAWFVGGDSSSVTTPRGHPAAEPPGPGSERLPGLASEDTDDARLPPVLSAPPAPAPGVPAKTTIEGVAPRASPGRLAGVVLSAIGDLPLTTFVLRLRHEDEPGLKGWSEAETHRVQSSSGSFDLGLREPGLYGLRVTAPGHLPFELPGLVVPGAEQLRLRLGVGSMMTGWVTDAFGRNAADIAVELRPLASPAPESARFVRRERTDVRGRYTFTDVAGGDWQVALPDPHGASRPLALSPPWTAGQDNQGLWDIQLPAEASLHIDVRCNGVAAEAGTRVRLVDDAGRVIQRKLGGGLAHFLRLRPGAYELAVEYASGSPAWQESIVVLQAPDPQQRRLDIPPPPQPALGDG